MSSTRQIRKAIADESLVRVYRGKIEDGWTDGYIAGIGPEFLAIEIVDETVRFNGFVCIRCIDVTSIDVPSPHAGFLIRALKAQGLNRYKNFPPDLSSLKSLLETARTLFPLLTVHLEVREPEICFIGEMVSVTDRELELRLVTPDADWHDNTKLISLKDITRVEFGGAYERALFLVAGSH